MEAMMNKVELNSEELEMANGGDQNYVIDLSDSDYIDLDLVSTFSRRVPDQRKEQFEYNNSTDFDF